MMDFILGSQTLTALVLIGGLVAAAQIAGLLAPVLRLLDPVSAFLSPIAGAAGQWAVSAAEAFGRGLAVLTSRGDALFAAVIIAGVAGASVFGVGERRAAPIKSELAECKSQLTAKTTKKKPRDERAREPHAFDWLF